MSFVDFLRAYWANHRPPRHRNQVNEANLPARNVANDGPRGRMRMQQDAVPNAADIQRNLDELDRMLREQGLDNIANDINAGGAG